MYWLTGFDKVIPVVCSRDLWPMLGFLQDEPLPRLQGRSTSLSTIPWVSYPPPLVCLVRFALADHPSTAAHSSEPS